MKRSEFPELEWAVDSKVQNFVHQCCRNTAILAARTLYGTDEATKKRAVMNRFKIVDAALRSILIFFQSKKACNGWMIFQECVKPVNGAVLRVDFTIHFYRRKDHKPTSLYVYLTLWPDHQWTVL